MTHDSSNVLALLARSALQDAVEAEALGDYQKAAIEWLVARNFYAAIDKGILAVACNLRAKEACYEHAQRKVNAKPDAAKAPRRN